MSISASDVVPFTQARAHLEHYDKLTDQARRRLPLRPIQFLFPRG